MFFGEDIFNWALQKCTLSKRSKINHFEERGRGKEITLT
jgi:hypothetical protein